MIRKVVVLLLVVFIFSTLPFAAFADEEENGPFTLDAPKKLAAELKYDEEGLPYFALTLDVPESVQKINQNLLDDDGYYQGTSCYPVEIQFEYKFGDYDWNEGPSLYWNTDRPLDEFLSEGFYEYRPYEDVDSAGSINIESEVYNFRASFFSNWGYEDDWIDNYVRSEYSNLVTVGNTAYYKGASNWAEPELDKAAEYGLITDSIKDKMSEPITREEFAELAVRLYEKMTGKKAEPASPNPFTDTKNPEVLKANRLGIIDGIGNNKFDPKALTNREQVSTMLGRAIRVMVPDADFSIKDAPTFSDEKQISSWALEHVKYMSKLGIVKGTNGKFMPKAVTTAEIASGYATTTCEQAVIMSSRIYENFKDE